MFEIKDMPQSPYTECSGASMGLIRACVEFAVTQCIEIAVRKESNFDAIEKVLFGPEKHIEIPGGFFELIRMMATQSVQRHLSPEEEIIIDTAYILITSEIMYGVDVQQ